MISMISRHGVQVLVTAFTVVPSRSGAVRTFEQRTVLEQFNPRCVAVSLSGYIFFGSSVKISDKVLEVRCLQSHTWPVLTDTAGCAGLLGMLTVCMPLCCLLQASP